MPSTAGPFFSGSFSPKLPTQYPEYIAPEICSVLGYPPIGQYADQRDLWWLARAALVLVRKGIPLSRLLAGVANAVAQTFSEGVWTTAEVVRASINKGHYYLNYLSAAKAERSSPRPARSSGRALLRHY